MFLFQIRVVRGLLGHIFLQRAMLPLHQKKKGRGLSQDGWIQATWDSGIFWRKEYLLLSTLLNRTNCYIFKKLCVIDTNKSLNRKIFLLLHFPDLRWCFTRASIDPFGKNVVSVGHYFLHWFQRLIGSLPFTQHSSLYASLLKLCAWRKRTTFSRETGGHFFSQRYTGLWHPLL